MLNSDSIIGSWLAVAAVALVLGGAMVALIEIGRGLALRRFGREPDGQQAGVSTVDGAVFALFGLLIAFTFSGAGQRFDWRRALVTEEANAIGTAWLRLELLPSAAQPGLRTLFRSYLDSRLETYRKLPDAAAAYRELARSVQLQGQIWTQAVSAVREAPTPIAGMLLLPALNQMIDITTTRTVAAQMHPPSVVFFMLVALALVSALLAGYGMARGGQRSWVHVLAFAGIIATTVYVIVDMEYPRFGMIRVDAVDQVLKDLRQSMN
jgi:hypothetical protein